MMGLLVFALAIGWQMFMNDANPAVVMTQYAPYLYKWHVWSTIIGQVFFVAISLLCFLVAVTDKDKSEKDFLTRVWLFLVGSGLKELTAGLAAIAGTTLLIKATEHNPTVVTDMPTNLVFGFILMYLVVIWFGLKDSVSKFPKKDKS